MAKLSLTKSDMEYINEFYGKDVAGFLKLWGGNNKSGIFPYGKTFCDEHVSEIFRMDKLPTSNLYMSVSTFYGKKKATVDNIRSVQCIPIDIDFQFTDKYGELLDPLKVWQMFQKDLIEKQVFFPMPTYIEYGRRMRFIYLLNDGGIVLPRFNKKKRKNVLTLLRRIQEELIVTINTLNPLYHAEYNPYTSFVRVPTSLNTIWGKSFNPGEPFGTPSFHIDEQYFVQVKKVSNGKRYDFHELADEILPKLPDWYKAEKKKKKRGPEIHICGINSRSVSEMLCERCHFLEILQDHGYDIGFREVMCFLYWNFSMQAGMTEDEAKLATLNFNRGFEHPMREKEVISLSRPRKLYYYRMETVLKKLCVPTELASCCGYDCTNKKEYQKNYMREYRKYKKSKNARKESQKQKMIRRLISSAKKFREKGMALLDIASRLNVSLSTAKRYVYSPT